MSEKAAHQSAFASKQEIEALSGLLTSYALLFFPPDMAISQWFSDEAMSKCISAFVALLRDAVASFLPCGMAMYVYVSESSVARRHSDGRRILSADRLAVNQQRGARKRDQSEKRGKSIVGHASLVRRRRRIAPSNAEESVCGRAHCFPAHATRLPCH
jgi:hypothetical protein